VLCLLWIEGVVMLRIRDEVGTKPHLVHAWLDSLAKAILKAEIDRAQLFLICGAWRRYEQRSGSEERCES